MHHFDGAEAEDAESVDVPLLRDLSQGVKTVAGSFRTLLKLIQTFPRIKQGWAICPSRLEETFAICVPGVSSTDESEQGDFTFPWTSLKDVSKLTVEICKLFFIAQSNFGNFF